MNLRSLVWVSSISIAFLFLPSLALKILNAPWEFKRWLVYAVLALVIVHIAKKRWRNKFDSAKNKPLEPEVSPLLLAKQRLAKGEIGLEEFREIRQELKTE